MYGRRSIRTAAGVATFLLAIIMCTSESIAPFLEGIAQVVDGDTLELDGKRVRIWGVDAPERSQTCRLAVQTWHCGTSATEALSRLVEGRVVRCGPRDRDRNERVVAVCTIDGSDIGATMVREGWALNFERYAKGFYRDAQQDARVRRAGLWQGLFIPPWQWRREH